MSERWQGHRGPIFRIGDVLKEPVYRRQTGRSPVLLLAAGHRIESELQLRQLRDEGYSVALPSEAVASSRPPSATPGPINPQPAGDDSDPGIEFSRRVESAYRVHETVVDAIREVLVRVGAGGAIPLERMEQASADLLAQVRSDTSAVVALTYLRRCDDYTVEHSANVATLMIAIARLLGVSEPDLPVLALAGLMHDVGKQRVPGHILNKPGTLTRDEFEEIRKHPMHGYEILSACAACPDAVRIVALQHHERLDGGGYPSGTTGLHPYSRIASVADAFDAMTSDRVYRRAVPTRPVLLELFRESGTRLDPEAVDALIKLVGVYPVGTRVRLDTGECGIVVAPNPEDTTRPAVRIDRGPNGRRVYPPRLCCLHASPHRVVAAEE